MQCACAHAAEITRARASPRQLEAGLEGLLVQATAAAADAALRPTLKVAAAG